MIINSNILTCSRCRHVWKPRKKKIIKYCPKCKSPYWNSPRKKISKDSVEGLLKTSKKLHGKIIETTGGENGIRDEGGLYSALFNVLSVYNKNPKDPIIVGALVYDKFARRHFFVDGNKRTAHVLARAIMLSLRCHLKVDYKEAVRFIIEIAKYDSKITLPDIKKWLNSNCTAINEKDIDRYIRDMLVDLVVGGNDEQE